MKLLAVSDLHVSHAANLRVVRELPASPDDWLVVAGDVAETAADLAAALSVLVRRFARVVWTPGNHELWTVPHDPLQLRGRERYEYLVEMCRGLGVLTPEDPYPVLECEERRFVLAPLFLLYDYSLRPPGTTAAQALERAYEAGVVCSDEFLLHPDPYPDRAAWCADRLALTERRLAALPADLPVVFANHYPLHPSLVRLPRVPEFSLWCGTARTADWHLRHRAEAVVYGHLHLPGSYTLDGVRFEEVSLGYPREWRRRRGAYRPRQIMPAPPARASNTSATRTTPG
ncbi:3',5'-cyclic AMP phosphodiesterase CpdA [Streptosporangium becharense]|uniref:3',5'-cyclic AMP phosphodiesterase CpdA n=1 Tax=Streptosporangium becharense TaxID=1816182 RepID=A0A7W9IMN7_9ACTN|nr:metallophosphoesterase [Streptosporangium becharense]MBB2910388.1 3',5'-cyclic AMP phosphodiesterase CpdA [Streptosporangium becharense]MBB5823131.1 3',5'-cyclic AMP phosphodiesterase CpdA [Streptosporangium becharense]